MGDRSNIVIKEGKEEVFLYGHNMGRHYISVLAEALTRGRDRWQDPSYLARIVFCEMTKDTKAETTGYGIWCSLTDNEHPLLVVDCPNRAVRLETEKGRKVLLADSMEGFLSHLAEFNKIVAAN